MGICCCRTENPCDNLEERNGLLKDDSKGTVPCDDRGVVGSCGPDRADEVRKSADEASVKVEEKAAAVQLKKSSVNGETKVNNAQENGPLLREVAPAAIHSPGKKQEDASGVQDKDVEGSLDSGGQADLLQCTFDSVHTEISSASWEVRPETSAVTAEAMAPSVEDRIPVGLAQPAEEANPPHIKTNTTTPDTNQTDDGDASELTVAHAATDPSEEISQNNEMVSVPNTHSPTAAEGQVLSVTVVSQEINSEPSVVTVDPECSSAREDYEPEDIQGHAASDLSGLESAGLDHSGEERDSANTVSEPATTSRAAASESPKPTKDDEPQLATGSNAAAPSEKVKQDAGEESLPQAQNKDVPKVKETEEGEGEVAAAAVVAAAARAPAEDEEDAEIEEASEEEQQVAESTFTHDAETADSERQDTSDGDLTRSEDDLYRGAEELSASQGDTLGPPATLETTLSKVEDRCSLDPAVDILQYSEREWKGNTAKSVLIRKGYKEMSQRFGGVRRVRGDNYCALRATLFQVLAHTTQLPAWLQDQDVSLLPQELEAQEGLISQWTFPGRWPQGDGGRDVTQQLKGCMELLQNKWREAAGCATAAERQQLCQSVFQGGEEELGLLEALKLLMLGRAAQLHARMRGGADVPLFCWLLFARDSSDSPRSFLANHLSHVGISAGLEQVEMFLLGYALHCTIQVYRLYKADTEEFVTYYPDDHKDEWPSVCLVTEDDRHYNVPVEEAAAAAEALEELASS